jgi:hypothetical protein
LKNYQKEKQLTFLADNCWRQVLQLAPTTGLHAGEDSPDFISKMGIVEEGADESIYWMELLLDCELIRKDDVSLLLNEANQILAMTVSSIRTARRKKQQHIHRTVSSLYVCLLFRNPHSAFRILDSLS